MSKDYSKWPYLVILPVWIYAGFLIAQLTTVALSYLLGYLRLPISSLPDVVLNTAASAIVYMIMLLIVVGVPMFIKKTLLSKKDFGVNRLPSWMDIWMAPAGFIVYVIFSAVLILIASKFIPGFDINQVQDTGFSNLSVKYQYYLAFITLVVMAPLFEELIFRGYLFNQLRRRFPFWITALVVSIAFGSIHGAWNVGVDTFALSLILCYLREHTGSLWSSVILHMIKNGIAYFFLFIYPLL